MNFGNRWRALWRRRARLQTSFVVFALTASLLVVGPSSSPVKAAPMIPAGFSDVVMANVPGPTDLAFLPDGRMLVTRQAGVVRMIKDEALLPTPVLDISHKVCSRREEGLAGITVDPAFATNHFVYVYYTFKRVPTCYTYDDGSIVLTQYPVNRVSRFVMPVGSDVLDPASEVVLVDNMPALGIHISGDLAFGADGLLYISSGDGGCRVSDQTACQGSNNNARRLDLPLGKILRVTRDGAIPSTNPWAGAAGARHCTNPAGVPAGTGPCAEIFATGLRNPFRFGFKPGTDTFYINDVGLAAWEEIDLGARGADYGWNVREGHCAIRSTTDCGTPPAGMTNPIHDYHHSTGCGAITGGAFVPEDTWGAPYSGSYLFADFVCGKMFRLVPASGGGYTASELVTGLGSGSAVAMEFGPWLDTKALYYTTYADGGQVRRLGKTPPALQPPVASFTASPTSSPTAPLTVRFDASASTDPDNDPLTYHWDFGDGSVLDTTTSTTEHVYGAEGQFTATLRVEDDRQQSAQATKGITVGTPPGVTILSPASDGTFSSHQQLTLSARAVDGNGVTLPDSALQWDVVLHHESHIHPYFGPVTGNNLPVTYPSPEDLGAAATSYLEVRVTATSPTGLKTTVSQNAMPKKVTLTFGTNRSTALTLQIADQTTKGTTSFTSWVGLQFTISAPSPQSYPDRTYYFQSWSDGKPQSHVITTPGTNSTYTATFSRVNGPPPPTPPPPPPYVDIARTPTAQGYWMVSTDGTVRSFGDAPLKGSAPNRTDRPAVGMAATPTGQGYWVTGTDGAIFPIGDAVSYGSTGNLSLNQPIVGMAPTPTGRGYWLVATDGGIFSFGDARFYGSTGNIVLNKPIVGMAPTTTGQGYWLVASDGGIFSFGDARFSGSTGDIVLNKPIVGMSATTTGEGYWLVASDGGVFAFDAPFHGSLGGRSLTSPVSAMESTGGGGYWMVTGAGQIFPFGDARDYGSA